MAINTGSGEQFKSLLFAEFEYRLLFGQNHSSLALMQMAADGKMKHVQWELYRLVISVWYSWLTVSPARLSNEKNRLLPSMIIKYYIVIWTVALIF